MLAAPAFAGPSIVESGGYTFLPGMKLTGKGFFVPGTNDVTAKATTGIVIGTASGFPSLWLTTGTYTPSTSNYALSDSGSGLQINTPSSMLFRVVNATKMTMSTSALLLASGVDLQTVQGQSLTFDGATAAKKLSSDGTTLTLAGLKLTLTAPTSGTDAIIIPKGSRIQLNTTDDANNNTISSNGNGVITFGTGATEIDATLGQMNLRGVGVSSLLLGGFANDGASAVSIVLRSNTNFTTTGAKLVSFRNNTSTENAFIDKDGGFFSVNGGFTAQGSPPTIPSGVGIAIGNVSSFAALCVANTSYALGNCQLYSQGADTFLNAPAGNTLGFRINNAVLGTWGTAGLVIGSGGTAISKSVAGTGTLDFASAAISTCSADLTITVTGATAAAPVELGVPNGSVAAGSVFWSWTSATNTVSVRHCCVGAATCDPASGTFSARVMNP